MNFEQATATVVDENTMVVEGPSGGGIIFHFSNADAALTQDASGENALMVTSKKVATIWFEFSEIQLTANEGLRFYMQFSFSRQTNPPSVFRVGVYQKPLEVPQIGDQGLFFVLFPQNQTVNVAQTSAKGGRFLVSGPGVITSREPLPGIMLDDQPHSVDLTAFPKETDAGTTWLVNYSFDDNTVTGSHVFDANKDFSIRSFNMAAMVFSEDQVLTINNISVETVNESP